MRGVFLSSRKGKTDCNPDSSRSQAGDEETDNEDHHDDTHDHDNQVTGDSSHERKHRRRESVSQEEEQDSVMNSCSEHDDQEDMPLASQSHLNEPFHSKEKKMKHESVDMEDEDDNDDQEQDERIHHESETHEGRRHLTVKRKLLHDNPLLSDNKKPRNEDSSLTQESSFINRNGNTDNHTENEEESPENQFSNKTPDQRSRQITSSSKTRIVESMLSTLFSSIQAVVDFTLNLTIFQEVPSSDQESLLRSGVLEMLVLLTGFFYDKDRLGWPLTKTESAASRFWSRVTSGFQDSQGHHTEATARTESVMSPPASPSFTAFRKEIKQEKEEEGNGSRVEETVEKKTMTTPCSLSINSLRCLFKDEELLEKYKKLLELISCLDLDEVSILLVSLIVLFNPDRVSIVSRHQEYLLSLLKSFMNWRFGPQASSLILRKILLMLPDLKELAENMSDYPLVDCQEQVRSVHDRLSELRSTLERRSHKTLSSQHWCLRNDVLPSSLLDPSSLSSPSSTSTSTASLPVRVEYVSDHSSSSDSSYQSEQQGDSNGCSENLTSVMLVT